MKKILLRCLLCMSVLATGCVEEMQAVKIINGKKYFAYMVQDGETLESICNAFHVTAAEIEEANPGSIISLKPGRMLQVLVKESMMNADLPEVEIIKYVVKPGNTLFSLAKEFNSTIADIIQRNGDQLVDGVLISGSTLQIARNSGGLTGGEDKLRERKEAEAARNKMIADSLAKVQPSHWFGSWTVIDVVTPGTINKLKTDMEWRRITRLKVTGNANELDVKVIGKRIFEFDAIEVLDLHEIAGLKKISSNVFEECYSLLALSLPNTVDSIGVDAFARGGSSIESIRCYSLVPPKCKQESFNGVNRARCMLEVPADAVAAYQKDPVWKRFATIKAIPTDQK